MRTGLPVAACSLAFLLAAACPAGAGGGLAVTDLRCEYGQTAGVDVAQPRLSWAVESDERGQRQTAWQALAASSLDLLESGRGDLWDSGRVASDQTAQVPYAGRPLSTAQQVFWKIRAWDRDGQPSAWSAPARWLMGVLDEKDWRARWIGDGAPAGTGTLLLRREFTVKPRLRQATAFVCGLGQCEVTVNGCGDALSVLEPGWTKYDKTCLYVTRDLTATLRAGANAIGLFLGNGMYNVQGGRYAKFKGSFGPLQAIAQIRLEYADGSVEWIGSDEQWRAHPGPITFSCVYGGEDYDARAEPAGWDEPGFDAAAWKPAVALAGPGGRLRGGSCSAPPVGRHAHELRPVATNELRRGVSVYDLGLNASRMPRIRVRGPAGSSVRIIPAELVRADGAVDRGSCGGGDAWWQYTLAGRKVENYAPHFFYHGSRYLQVECRPAEGGTELPVIDSLRGELVESTSPQIGEFASSNELFNRTRTLIRWAQRSNMMSVLSDCPHRERLGWLEENHLNGPSLRYEFDLARFFAKNMNDMADSQLENGLVPDIAPEYTVFKGGFRDSPEWGSALLLVAWQQYEWTGDLELLRRHYEGMKRYVAYLGTRAKDGILSHGLGDWYDLGPKPPGVAQLTPIALTATAFYHADADIVARAAALLGQADDAKEYAALAGRIRAAFNRQFYRAEARSYATGSQCANALALVMGLCESADRAGVLDAIVADVRARGNGLSVGDVGYRYLLRALAEGGRSDVIFDMNSRSDKPGYGWQLAHGATSLTEAWDAGRGSSQNHFMLGHLMEWFYHDLAGIGGDPEGPGFRKIVLRPQPVGDVTWAKATLDTIRGRIASDWKREGATFAWQVAIPANTTATVFVPAGAAGDVTEGGGPAAKAAGVRFLRQEGGAAVFAVESGRYEFESKMEGMPPAPGGSEGKSESRSK